MFGKLKQLAGIGGVKVSLQAAGHVAKTDTTIAGTILLEAKNDQQVQSVEVEFVEEWKTGRGEEARTKKFTLGKLRIADAFEMKSGDMKQLEFQLPFSLIKSGNDVLKDQGGALGALGKMGAFANNEKSFYKLVAVADVKGTVLDPSATADIKLV